MLSKGYFDICTIDSVAKVLDVNPHCEEYDILRTLHCVHYDKMSRMVWDSIPELIMACLDRQTFQFALPSQAASNTAMTIDLKKDKHIKLRLPWTRD